MISHAQNFEDVILWRALKGVGQGSYIDIGAHDPVADSISLSFYKMGWRGVHVEPAPHYAQMLREARADEVVIEAAVGADPKPIPFWVFPGTGLSTGDPAIAAEHEANSRECLRIETPCIPLSQILDEHGADRPIHWLKIDVEGMEHSVIQSWAPSKVRPWIVLVESTKPGTTESTHEAWEPELLKLGYAFVYFDGLNRFYVSSEKSELKSVFGPGANIFDGFQLDQSSVFNIQLNADLVWRNNEINRLNNDLAASVALSNDRAAALVATSTALAQASEAHIAASAAWETAANTFEEATRSLQREASQLRQDKAALQEALDQRQAALAGVQGALDHHVAVVAAVQAALDQRQADVTHLHAVLASAQDVLAKRETELASARTELGAVRASTSWRISAPVRWFGRRVKTAPAARTEAAAPARALSPSPSPSPPPAASAAPPAEPSDLPTVQDIPTPLSPRAQQILADLESPES